MNPGSGSPGASNAATPEAIVSTGETVQNAPPITLRRVRFDTSIADDESIPGALAKAAREHVLPRLQTILQGAAIDSSRVGHVQLLPPEQLRLLAMTLRCDVDALIANAGERIHSQTHGATHQRVRFGDLTLFRSDLELKRRRIAPTTLTRLPHHRVAWLNRTLPYCPFSLEHLVDTCSRCSAPLAWKYSWGVEVCETCEETVLPSCEPPLPAAMADHYRLYASLVSPLPTERAAARASLPKRLHHVTYPTLIRLAVRIGLLCRDTPIINVRQHSLGDLPAETLASVVATGAAMLRDWPLSFTRFAYARADALRSDRNAYVEWRVMLRRLTVARTEGQELAGLILEALPDIGGVIERSFSGGRPHYLTNEAQRVIGISHERLSRAIDAGVFEMAEVPGLTRRRVQLDKASVDSVAELVRATPSINTLPGEFRLPLYAIEQLAVSGLLVRETHPAIRAIREAPCVVAASIATLKSQLSSVLGDGECPADAIPLQAAVRRIGGREKPWSKILLAILEGRVPAWGKCTGFTAKTVFVRPGDMVAFDLVQPDIGDGSFPFDPLITQEDCGELLNTAPKYMPEICEAFGLQFREVGRAQRADKQAVLAIARAMATSSEIGAQLGVHAKSVEARMRDLGVTRVGIGWVRDALIAQGILPPLP